MYGYAGSDTMKGLADGDGLYGGDEVDDLSGGSSSDEVYGGTGSDELDGGSGQDALYGQDGDDALIDGPESDAAVDTIRGGVGNDEITSANSPASRDVVYCGDGIDEVVADSLDDIENVACETVIIPVVGTAQNDTLAGTGSSDWISGMAGSDTIQGGSGDDTLSAADEAQTVGTSTDRDLVVGGDGKDKILGGLGADELRGGLGTDFITEGPENDAATDTVYGGDNDDSIFVASSPAYADNVSCGPGNDTVEVDSLDVVSADCEQVDVAAEVQALWDPPQCDVYRFYHSPVQPSKAGLPLRWGNNDFGYRHIKNERRFESRRIGYVLEYGYRVSGDGTRQRWRKKYPGDRRYYYVVFDTTYKSNACPNEYLGVITAFRGGS
jgi:Ca2+-binding RTX toxin-like protein